jgi:riboflavin kinase/FMN adenylyltransferase
LRAAFQPPQRAVVTVGVFDGVHRAHQQLIRTTVRLAERLKGTSVAITFDPDPQRVLDPAHVPSALMSLKERVVCLQSLGIERVWVLRFTPALSRMTAEAFVRHVLIRRLRAAALVVGDAFVFGHGRQGDLGLLRAVGRAVGMQVAAVRNVEQGGAPISSSRIRRLIELGQLNRAASLLGRPPRLAGTVVRGAGRGKRLGFPTANIRLMPHQVLPPQGVYAVRAWLPKRRRAVRGVMNFGMRPTFGHGPLVCEVHLLDSPGPLRGRWLTMALIARLRPERCFPSWDALQRQIRLDIAGTRRLFRTTRCLPDSCC